MKIRFTITLSDKTVRGFAASGVNGAQEIIVVLKSTLQDALDEVAPDEDDEEEK